MNAFSEQLDRDLAAVFFTDWATPAIYTPAGGAAQSVNVIFDRAYLSVDPDTQARIMSTEPMLLARAADLPDEITIDDRFVVAGRTYRPVEPRPDGQGLVEIYLEAI